ncbi:MAG TPA: J domain-containing protein, partial [Armatimonadota bacterium]|nr:J domain-containing protein [Armatimonadota bacterium]
RQTGTNILGFHVTTLVPCDRCGGSGEYIANPCHACGGTGRAPAAEEVTVEIPAGVEHGTRFRVRGKGEAGFRGARAGDLFVVVRLRPHARFQRHGRDLWCEVEVPFTTAALGGRVTIQALDGDGELELPPGTQYGEQLRLRGRGMPDMNARGRGDLVVKVKVVVPQQLTPRQRELLTELADDRGEDAPKARSAFQRLKDAAQHLLTGESDAPHEAKE